MTRNPDPSGKSSLPFPIGSGLCHRQVRVHRSDVAWLRYILEAEEGLANFHSEGFGPVDRGVVHLTCPTQREDELDAFIAELISDGVVSPAD